MKSRSATIIPLRKGRGDQGVEWWWGTASLVPSGAVRRQLVYRALMVALDGWWGTLGDP